MPVDFKLHPILFVDDEPQNLVVFRYALGDHFTIHTAASGQEALALMANHKFAVVLADQRMPQMTGVELCVRVRELDPDAVRIIITAYADIHAAIDAINLGQVSRYLVKPWRNEDLIEVLQTAIEFVHLQQAMRDMELRLLQGGQARIASAVHDQMLHEINNPLQGILANIGFATEILDTLLTTLEAESGAALFALLQPSLRELQQVHADAQAGVNQLAVLTKRGRSAPRQFMTAGLCDAGRVVESTLGIIRREVERVARLQVVLEHSPMVPVDATALGQIVLNLVLNAAQSIEGSGLTDRSVCVRLRVSEGAAHIAVIDDGPGVEPANLARIFQQHYTTKAKGSGLGLSIVREMVRRVGGDITVRSEVGGETVFEVSLPLAAAAQPERG